MDTLCKYDFRNGDLFVQLTGEAGKSPQSC